MWDTYSVSPACKHQTSARFERAAHTERGQPPLANGMRHTGGAVQAPSGGRTTSPRQIKLSTEDDGTMAQRFYTRRAPKSNQGLASDWLSHFRKCGQTGTT